MHDHVGHDAHAGHEDHSAGGAHGMHGAEEALCAEGLTRYRQAVVKGCTSKEDVPECLLRLGLLVTPPDDPEVLVPVAPDVALAELVRPIEERLERQRGDVRALTDSFSPVHAIYTVAKREHQGWATQIHGERVIDSTLAHAVRSCRGELMTVQPGGRRPAYGLDGLDHLRGGGVHHRALFQHAARSHSATLRHIGELLAAGAEVRTLGHVIDRLVVVDRTVAYVPGAAADDGRTSALEIRQPDLVAFLAQIFDDAWERATPVTTAAPRAPEPAVADDLQRATARLLVAGHTDEAIARRLGISRRTVAARVARLSAELGSGSRAQLGYLIAMSGLLRGEGGG